jgi:hypothetical protein
MLKFYRFLRCLIGVHNYQRYVIGTYCTRCDKLKKGSVHYENF